MLNRAALALLLSLASGAVLAQEQRCSIPSPVIDVQARHYAVDLTSNPSMIFGSSVAGPGCPSADAACTSPGNEVAVSEVMGLFTTGDYACVMYIMPRDPWGMPYRTGFLPLSILTPLAPGEVDWTGSWTLAFPPASITLTPGDDGTVHVEGVASNTEKTDGNVARNLYREDLISEDVTPRKNALAFEQTEEDIAAPHQGEFEGCPVRMWRAGPYLLVSDNPYCGGPDVSFSGLYAQQ